MFWWWDMYCAAQSYLFMHVGSYKGYHLNATVCHYTFFINSKFQLGINTNITVHEYGQEVDPQYMNICN